MTSPFGRRLGRPYIVTLFIAFVLVLSGESLRAHAEEALTVYHFRGHDSLSLAVFNGIVLWGAADQTGTGYRVPLAFESDIRSGGSILDFSAIYPLKLSEFVNSSCPKIIQGRTAHEKDSWRRNHPYPRFDHSDQGRIVIVEVPKAKVNPYYRAVQ